MAGRLLRLDDWEGLAEVSQYSASRLAGLCGVSVRTLERFFMLHRGCAPQRWLNDLRQRQALRLIATGLSAKEVATRLHYKQASHFSREFKRFHGFPPSDCFEVGRLMSPADMQCREKI